MTLQNLLGISLDAVSPNREAVARLLAAAERNLADATLPGDCISNAHLLLRLVKDWLKTQRPDLL